jgi:hypothetical protein
MSPGFAVITAADIDSPVRCASSSARGCMSHGWIRSSIRLKPFYFILVGKRRLQKPFQHRFTHEVFL